MWEQKNEQDQPVINQNCGSGSVLIRLVKSHQIMMISHIFVHTEAFSASIQILLEMLGLGHDPHGKFGKNADPQF
jgi:hypothetical protein